MSLLKGWGIEERRQSDVAAYSRAKERNVTTILFCSQGLGAPSRRRYSLVNTAPFAAMLQLYIWYVYIPIFIQDR